MQDLTVSEVEQVGGGLICSWTSMMIDLQGALNQVGATFDAGVSAVVDVACRITGDC